MPRDILYAAFSRFPAMSTETQTTFCVSEVLGSKGQSEARMAAEENNRSQQFCKKHPSPGILQPLPVATENMISFGRRVLQIACEPRFPNRNSEEIPSAKRLILKGRKSLNSNKITFCQAARTPLYGREFALPSGLITR